MTPLAATDLGQGTGPVAMFIVLLLGVALVLLIRNMDRRLKRLPRQFEPPGGPEHDEPEPRPDR